MNPTTRADLALFVPPEGLMIELGVAAGKFAELLCDRNPRARYIGIDRWADHHDQCEMKNAMLRLYKFERVLLHRMTFAEALSHFEDELADLVYIDGYAHTGQEGGQTLRDWWPKVKPGGIFAGHDYCREYQPTIEAVDTFVLEHGLELHIIDELPHPSWWVRKPNPKTP
jgi:predicted O-methyltransferase YrrM